MHQCLLMIWTNGILEPRKWINTLKIFCQNMPYVSFTLQIVPRQFSSKTFPSQISRWRDIGPYFQECFQYRRHFGRFPKAKSYFQAPKASLKIRFCFWSESKIVFSSLLSVQKQAWKYDFAFENLPKCLRYRMHSWKYGPYSLQSSNVILICYL